MVEQPSVEVIQQPKTENQEIITSNVTPVHDKGGGYVEFEEKLFQREALKELRPDLFSLKGNLGNQSSSNFGTQFPKIAKKGDIFVRVDVSPNRVFKFDGRKWIEVQKESTNSYMNERYIEFLIDKLDKGEYDLEQLTDNQKEIITDHLTGNRNS